MKRENVAGAIQNAMWGKVHRRVLSRVCLNVNNDAMDAVRFKVSDVVFNGNVQDKVRAKLQAQ